jgi:hypothetical protein
MDRNLKLLKGIQANRKFEGLACQALEHDVRGTKKRDL